MSLSTDCYDPERVEYHNWLLGIQDQQLREELLDIVSIWYILSLRNCFHLVLKCKWIYSLQLYQE